MYINIIRILYFLYHGDEVLLMARSSDVVFTTDILTCQQDGCFKIIKSSGKHIWKVCSVESYPSGTLFVKVDSSCMMRYDIPNNLV